MFQFERGDPLVCFQVAALVKQSTDGRPRWWPRFLHNDFDENRFTLLHFDVVFITCDVATIHDRILPEIVHLAPTYRICTVMC